MKISCTSLEISDVTEELFPPLRSWPQVTTEPSSLRAANADWVAKTSLTPEDSESMTDELSPPFSFSPHVTTEPSSFNATNAL